MVEGVCVARIVDHKTKRGEAASVVYSHPGMYKETKNYVAYLVYWH